MIELIHLVKRYGEVVAVNIMLAIIADRRGVGGDVTPEWYRRNSAEPGPNGLVRHLLDGSHCIAHGVETYDLIVTPSARKA